MAKVYVVTKAELFQPEVYVTVKATKKEAEKVVRADFPNARKDGDSYLCRKGDRESLMFVHEETI